MLIVGWVLILVSVIFVGHFMNGINQNYIDPAWNNWSSLCRWPTWLYSGGIGIILLTTGIFSLYLGQG